jgi:DNA repair protein RadA/Sms
MKELKPDIVVIDSIQTVYKQEIPSSPGSVSQVRENAFYLSFLAKNLGTTMFFIGHITKDGTVAGPKVLEHIVDTVLYFEGEAHHSFRILRAVKNRFGSTNEIGIFEMTGTGLKEVQNPSQMLLKERTEDSSGTIVVPSIEGSRPLLIEVQSLTSYNGGFGAGRRTTSGVDHRRVGLLIAVLEKKLGLNLYDHDVYVNVAGGLSIDEPAIDLGIALSILSSFRNKPIDISLVAAGEIGLTGEVRAVTQMEKRISEASRLGFKKAIISKNNISDSLNRFNIEILPVKNVQEAVEIIM